jgi:CIC family chloride channel protein
MAIVTNLYLLSQILHHHFPVIAAVACLLLGELLFLGWKLRQLERAASPITPSEVVLEEPAVNPGKFRVLVPLANPDHANQLIALAAAIATEHQGEIIALRGVQISEQTPPGQESTHIENEKEILELARSQAHRYQIPITSLVRVGHNIAQAILETASERSCDLILLGWKGHTSAFGKIFGAVVDEVVNSARTDVILVKLGNEESLRRFLLPTAGGAHAQRAEKYAASFINFFDGALTVCSVIPPDATTDGDRVNRSRKILDQTVTRITKTYGLNPKSEIVSHISVSDGVTQEAENDDLAKSYDAIIVGASDRSMYPKVLFGSIPESIAKNSRQTVILVKYYQPVQSLIGRLVEE